jgi:hypothetical protein
MYGCAGEEITMPTIMLKSYIVRIYRHDSEEPGSIVGTVEEACIEGKRAFTNLAGLGEILNPPEKNDAKKMR